MKSKSASKIDLNKNSEMNEKILQFLPDLLYNQKGVDCDEISHTPQLSWLMSSVSPIISQSYFKSTDSLIQEVNRLSSSPYTSNYKEISDFPLLSSQTILSHFLLYKSLWDMNMEINDKNLSLIENNVFKNKKSDSFWSIRYDPGGFIQNEKNDLLSAIGRDVFVLLAGSFKTV
jgi:hypothetical protein